MTEQQKKDDVGAIVQAQIDEAAKTRAKYGHPDPDTHEADPDHPGIGFVRWVQKGGHLDPAAEEQRPEYLELFKKLGGDDDGVTLESGERVTRNHLGEAPPANREQPTTDPENAELDKGATVLKTGEYEDAKPNPPAGTEREAEREAESKPQGITKAKLKASGTKTSSSTAKS